MSVQIGPARTGTHPSAAAGGLRSRSGLGGSHTVVTYPPLNALEPLEGEEPFRIDASAPVHLYFHIAFCEFICAFCHYQRTFTHPDRAAPAVDPYIAAIGQEIDHRRPALAGAQIASVYLGGGTPTALTLPTLERLIGHVRRLVDLPASYFAFETSPKTVVERDGRAKLALLVAEGAKRVSMGVQTFDDTILHQQRGHGVAELNAALAVVMGLGVKVNIDLIQDLPFQTDAHIDADVASVATLMPDQVTWYTLRTQKGSVLGKLEGSPSPRSTAVFSSIPDGAASVERRLRIIRDMRMLGYHARPGGRFILEPKGCDLFKTVRSGLTPHLLGFGMSSYSHGWGHFFRNVGSSRVGRAITDYIERMGSGRSPVGACMRLTDLEEAASQVVLAARSFIPHELLDRDDESGRGWRCAALHCVDAGLLDLEADGYRLTELGLALEEEVASLFYSAPVRDRLSERGLYWARPEWFRI